MVNYSCRFDITKGSIGFIFKAFEQYEKAAQQHFSIV
jgi:hypothetical protein